MAALGRCFSRGSTGVQRERIAARAFMAGPSDSWAPERLGVRTFDPIKAHRSGLSHQPGSVTPQKHTFALNYFRSTPCRDLLKVAWEGAVKINIEDGRFAPVAKRAVRAGEIVERGILRGAGMGVLEDKAPNPFVFKLGQDFLLNTGFPWGQQSDIPGPAFLASGALMFYRRSASRFNVDILVRESPTQGFEFDAVASEDIPAGAPLVRRVANELIAPMPRYADQYHISDDQLDAFLGQCRELDSTRATLAGVEPEQLHERVIREHVEQTRREEVPPLWSDKTVTLPHPTWGGFGVFACEDIQAGEIVESGLHGKIEGLSGDKCPYVFTWNKDGQRYTDGRENVWATGSGNAMFYNSDYPSNVRMYRFFDHFRYLMVAKTDIKEGEEVMHLYASSSWRKCFVQDEHLPKMLPIEQQGLQVAVQ